eukprot:CAMPEP_0184300718 /NCGR_PEP_ID=MMETSP1049-20130417/11078_1 /TAXON_ID=77928 /ORGANISM="Proteomonas sulcata, Strain CCMP704" /LENGTH=91 /DNA_ID=CAMNT_0026611523 /DNA_START=473 /DNA_END=749 /DNA_ORIENTATION=-
MALSLLQETMNPSDNPTSKDGPAPRTAQMLLAGPPQARAREGGCLRECWTVNLGPAPSAQSKAPTFSKVQQTPPTPSPVAMADSKGPAPEA